LQDTRTSHRPGRNIFPARTSTTIGWKPGERGLPVFIYGADLAIDYAIPRLFRRWPPAARQYAPGSGTSDVRVHCVGRSVLAPHRLLSGPSPAPASPSGRMPGFDLSLSEMTGGSALNPLAAVWHCARSRAPLAKAWQHATSTFRPPRSGHLSRFCVSRQVG
jgi:hypothetical protein